MRTPSSDAPPCSATDPVAAMSASVSEAAWASTRPKPSALMGRMVALLAAARKSANQKAHGEETRSEHLPPVYVRFDGKERIAGGVHRVNKWHRDDPGGMRGVIVVEVAP